MRDVDGDTDGVVDPLLHTALHLHLVHPVDVVGCGLVIGRFGDDFVQSFVVVLHHLLHIVAVYLQPSDELVVEDIVLFEGVAHTVDEGGVDVGVVGVDFAATFVHHHEHWFDTRGGLGADAHSACRGDGEHGDVAASHTQHLLVKVFVDGPNALDEGVVFLPLGVENGETTAFLGKVDRGTIGVVSQQFLDFGGESNGFVRSVTLAQGS